MRLTVATHDGTFHADDAFAVAAIRLAHPGRDVQVIRSRDPRQLAACDLRVDVGRASDPDAGDFDHHQPGGAGARPNGIPYAAFGLVWRHHGAAIAGSQDAADLIDRQLVQVIDANDTGYDVFDSRHDGVDPFGADRVIAALNPSWEEPAGPEDLLARFHEAVALAGAILERQAARAAGQIRASQLVRAAAAQAPDPRIVELPRFMPWRDVIVTEFPDAALVLFPRPDGWAMQAVPAQLGSFQNRLSLPEAWAGLAGSELEQACGVPGAVFAHAGRFFAAAGTRDAVREMAARALAAA